MANLISEQFSRQQLSEFFGLSGKDLSARIVDEKRAGRMIEMRSYAEPTKSNRKVQRFCIFASNAELAL
jgi:hypothetical protein